MTPQRMIEEHENSMNAGLGELLRSKIGESAALNLRYEGTVKISA